MSYSNCQTATVSTDRRATPPATNWYWQRNRKVGMGSATEARLVEEHLPLVRNVVGRLAMSLPTHVTQQDLYSSGLVGLLNAVRNFNPNSGTSFETYARVRIRGAILDELRRLDWVPRSVHAKARKVQAAIRKLEQQKGLPPSERDVAKALRMNLEDYQKLLDEIRPATFVPLDAVGGDDEDRATPRYESVMDHQQESPLDGTARREAAAMLAESIQELPEMQRKVLALYYYEDMRLREIAEIFGLTESRICQIHAQAVMALRVVLEEHDLPLP
jgi:RNA polymerase sigma factor for flagellar operon FliA